MPFLNMTGLGKQVKLLRRFKKLEVKHPELVTLGDCELAYQMGYSSIIEDHKFKGFRRRNK